MQQIRASFLAVLLVAQIVFIGVSGFSKIIQYEGWGLLATIFAMYFSYMAGTEQNKNKHSLITIAAVSCQVSISYNQLICLIYWGFIHWQKLNLYEDPE